MRSVDALRSGGPSRSVGGLAMSRYCYAAAFLLVVIGPMQGCDSGVLDLEKAHRIVAVPGSSVPLSSRLGVNIHSLNDDAALDSAQSAGFSFVRMDLVWASVEKNGAYDFSEYDHLLASVEARGMSVLWILDYGHPEHGGAQPHSSADIAAFARYAEAAASHFHGHKARYEIWNEPNLKRFLPEPSVYPELLNQAIAAIRKADALAPISTGGISGLDFRFLSRFVRNATGPDVDAIAVHPYRDTRPETVSSDWARLRSLVDAQFRPRMPIWDTEWGYSSAGFSPEALYGDGHADAARKRQAVFAVRQFLTVWMLNLPVAVWYDLRDDGSDPQDRESNFGLLDQNGRDKTSMRAIRTLTAAAKDRLIGIVAGAPEGLHALKLESDDADSTFIVWCDQPGHVSKVRFSAHSFQSAKNMTGGEIRPTLASEGVAMIAINEADGPVYLHLRHPSH